MLEEYAIIKGQIALLEKQATALVPQIIEHLRSEGLKKVENSLGQYSITQLKKWTYPASIAKAEDKLKADKAKMQSTGDATFEEVPSLRFTPINL